VHGQAAGDEQSANGTRGAAPLRNRFPFKAWAAAQLAPVQTIDTAFQRFAGGLGMAGNVPSVRYLTQLRVGLQLLATSRQENKARPPGAGGP